MMFQIKLYLILMFSMKISSQMDTLLQFPFEDGVNIGPGVHIDSGEFKEMAIVINQEVKAISNLISSDKIKISSITSTDTLASNIKASAEFDFSGWGASAQAKFAYEQSSNFNQNSIIFQSKRIIDIGYQGLDLAQPPQLTESAKNHLKNYGIQSFNDRFGHFFIVGVKRGASCTINLKYDKKESSQKVDIDASLSLSFSGFGVDAKGSVEFKNKMEQKYGLTNQKIFIEYKGTKIGGNSSKICENIEEANEILQKFNKSYGEGSGIYFVLAPYSLLTDYQDIIYSNEYPTGEITPLNDQIINYLYEDLVVLNVCLNIIKQSCQSFQQYAFELRYKTTIYTLIKEYEKVANGKNSEKAMQKIGEAKKIYEEIDKKEAEYCKR